jgi:DNA repair protein RadA
MPEPTNKTVELTDIRGIGEETGAKLIAKGITNPAQIANMRPDELKAELGITLKKAKDIIQDALSQVLKTTIECKLADELDKEMKEKVRIISTNSGSLDMVLRGGIRTDSLTGLSGEYSVGKSQLCFQLLVNNVVDHKKKGVFVETEPDTWYGDRIREIATAKGYKDDILKEIYVIPAKSIVDAYSQYNAYLRVEQLCEEGKDIGMLCVDSFNSKFRSSFTGREQLPDRSREYGRQIGFLQRLASKYNMAVILTIQVMGIPDQIAQFKNVAKTGMHKAPVVPDIVLHGIGTWIGLTQIGKNSWKASLFDSSYLPRGEAAFSVLKEGIRDYIGKLKE